MWNVKNKKETSRLTLLSTSDALKNTSKTKSKYINTVNSGSSNYRGEVHSKILHSSYIFPFFIFEVIARSLDVDRRLYVFVLFYSSRLFHDTFLTSAIQISPRDSIRKVLDCLDSILTWFQWLESVTRNSIKISKLWFHGRRLKLCSRLVW